MKEWDQGFESILRRNLPLLSDSNPLEPDARLSNLGLDSLQTVSMLVELESHYELAIPDDALSVEIFATPSDLWAVIAEHMQTG
ncbi:acyl carrier protein [Nonomuraea sp. NPDC049129]|uniref:acyl carrier protein n=1 Tax=Nonomuraea sp. NPDC049129 TaxID=3155272 RepID=UPI0033DBED15